MGRSKSRRKRDWGKQAPRVLGWSGLTLSAAGIASGMALAHPGIGFALSWTAFIGAIIGLGLELVRQKSPRVTVVALAAACLAVGLCANQIRLDQLRALEKETAGGPQRRLPSSLDEPILNADRPRLDTKVNIGEITGSGLKKDFTLQDPAEEIQGSSAPSADPVASSDDPMQIRFGVDSVDRMDDPDASAELKGAGLIMKSELIPSVSKEVDFDATIEVSFVKPRASDELLRRLGPRLGRLPNLRVLNLFGGQVSELGLASIPAADVLSEITLPTATDGVVSQLSRFQQLRTVLFIRRGELTNAGLESLARLTRLEKLDLGVPEAPSKRITDAGLLNLGRLPHLKMLVAVQTAVTDDGATVFTSLPELEHLDLSACQVEDAGLKSFEALKRLTWVRLRKTAIEGPGLEYLAGCQALEVLNLSEIPQFDADQLKHLSRLPKLTELVLSGTRLDERATAHLKELKHLKLLQLDDCGLSAASIATLRESLPGCVIEAASLFK